jgi:hypothetical protein
MVPHLHGNEGLPPFSYKLALINTTCKELLVCAQHCPFSSFLPAVMVYDALLKNVFTIEVDCFVSLLSLYLEGEMIY